MAARRQVPVEAFRDRLDLLLRLREEETTSWRGRYRPPLHEAEIAPHAVQGALPVWVGAARRAAPSAPVGSACR